LSLKGVILPPNRHFGLVLTVDRLRLTDLQASATFLELAKPSIY